MAQNSNNTPQQKTITLTPGSDFIFNFREDQNVWGRHGSDTLLGFDPAAPIPTPPPLTDLEGSASQFRYNILLGDFIEEDISPELFVRPDQVPPGKDTFILGDWRKPYYLDNFALGLQQIAIVADFQPQSDTIQLHGSKEEYLLIPFALAGPGPDGEFTTINGEALVWIGSSGFTNKADYDVSQVIAAFEEAGVVANFDEFSPEIKELFNIEEFEEVVPDPVNPGVNLRGADISDDPEFEADGFEDSVTLNSTSDGLAAAQEKKPKKDKKYKVDIDDVLASTPDFDIVAFFPDVPPGPGLPAEGLPLPDISLDGAYFDFAGKAPPPGPTNNNIKQMGTNGVDVAIDVTTDDKGNFYVIGNTTGALKGANQGGYDVWIAQYDQKGKQKWIQQYGTAQGDVGWEIEAFTDQKGKTNLYVTGATTGSLAQKYGGTGANEGYQDIWIARLDDKGKIIWIQQNPQPIGGAEIDNSLNIDVDAAGNLYQSGITAEAVDSPLAPIQDFSWVAKYNQSGALQWFNGNSLESTDQVGFDETYGVAASADGSTYATGFTQNNLGGPRIGVYDLWLSRFDTQGQQLWVKKFGSVNYEFGWGVDTDKQNNAYVAGLTRGDLGGPNQGENDVFITKYDSSGNQQWIKQFGTAGDDGLYLGDITVDDAGNIYVAGFTDSVLAGGSNQGGYDAWVAKYDTNGQQRWISQFGSSELDFSSGLTVDDKGQVYVTGYTQGSLGAVNNGSVDAWITKIDSNTGAIANFSANVGA